jgi:hypothetical protein
MVLISEIVGTLNGAETAGSFFANAVWFSFSFERCCRRLLRLLLLLLLRLLLRLLLLLR